MKKFNTIIKAILYISSIILALVSIYLFFGSSINKGGGGEDIGETTGTILAIAMGFEILLFFGLQSLKRKLVPKIIKSYVVFIVKYLLEYHRSVGSIAIGILLFHYSQTFNASNPFAIQQITGYATTALVVISLGIGLIYRLNKKELNKLHILTAFLAIIPFLIHLAD